MLYEEKKIANFPYSRRQFIKGIGALGMLTTIPWLSSCQVDVPVKEGILGKHSQMTADIMEILFPADGNGPDATQIHAYQYLNWVLSDENYDKDIQKSIIKGLGKLAEFALEHFGKPYGKMSQKDKISLVEKAVQTTWGENLMARLVSMILDALVIDPIYGVNTNEVGWNWLGHTPGLPRAKSQDKYPEILERKEAIGIISSLKDL